MNQLSAIAITILLFAGVYYVSYSDQKPYTDPVDEPNACIVKKVPYGAPLSISEAQGGVYHYTLITTPDGIEVWSEPCK